MSRIQAVSSAAARITASPDSNPPAGSEGTDTLTRATLIYGF